MKEAINLSDFPENKIYVLLNKLTREGLIKGSIKKLGLRNYFELSQIINKRFKTNFNGGDVKYWFKGKRLDKRTGKVHPKFMPLWFVRFLSEINRNSLNSLQSKVISYRSGGKGSIVSSPKLPIRITPELDSVVIHLFADGSVGKSTPSYMQKRKEVLVNFLRKLENCFGKFEKKTYFSEDRYQMRFPKAITDILSKHYQIKSYSTYDSKVPRLIKNRKDVEFKLASLVSFIVDEGFIRDVVTVYSANKILIRDIRNLALDCKYGCSGIQHNKKAHSYLFTLKNDSLNKFYLDLKDLKIRFSTCGLQFREKDLFFILEVMNRKKPKNSKITDSKILKVLKDSKKGVSAKEISRTSFYAYCTVLHRLQNLMAENVVVRKKTLNGTYLWNLH